MPTTVAPRTTTALVLAACALALLPTLAFRIGVDQGAFAYMAAVLLDGGWPYLATWENDFPGLVFLQAAEILVLGKSVASFRFFDIVIQLLNAYLIHRIADRAAGRVAAVIAPLLFCLVYQGYGPWNTAQREGFAMLFALAGFWWYLTADRRAPYLTAIGVGLGMGVAVTFKPTLLALSLFYLPLVRELRTRRALGLAVVAGVSLLLPSAIVIVGYWMAGGLREMYDACIGYQAIYTERLRGESSRVMFWIDKLRQMGVNTVALPLVYVPFLFAGTNRGVRLMIWLAYVGAAYAVFVQGTFAGYHYLPGLAVGSVLTGSLVAMTLERVLALAPLRSLTRLVSPMAVTVLLMAAASLYYMRHAPIGHLVTLRFLGPPAPDEFRNDTVFDFTESHDVAAYIRARTSAADRIQIWGYESLTYYLAERRAASRFQMTHPLVTRVPGEPLSEMQQRWRREFLDDIAQQRPAFVAVVRQDNWWWAPEEKTSEQLLDDFPEWKAVIARDYTLETTIGRFLVYRRRG